MQTHPTHTPRPYTQQTHITQTHTTAQPTHRTQTHTTTQPTHMTHGLITWTHFFKNINCVPISK